MRGSSCGTLFADNLLRAAVLVLALLSSCNARLASACGPDFPNTLLDGGDCTLLVAPLAHFERELERMQLASSRFQARPAAGGASRGDFARQALEAELTDLRGALKKAKRTGEEAERLVTNHRSEREKLLQYVANLARWQESGKTAPDEHDQQRKNPKSPALSFPTLEYADGLPAEFVDYLEGAGAWHNPAFADRGMAREAWERLLARPPAERRFKSTWAAFMLGRSWEETAPDKAIEYFRLTRDLARQGLADSTGLAAASLGLEARIFFARGEFASAIRLYLEQLATGDPTAANSLRLVAAAALGDPDVLQELARDDRAQRVITAYLISWRGAPWSDREATLKSSNEITEGWLTAVEAAGVNDVDSAEKLALVAYQAGAFDVAQRWIDRAKGSSLTQWLRAKLLLRAGKVAQAAALLARVTRSLPLDAPGTNPPVRLVDNLSVEVNRSSLENITGGRQALGELGVLRLARRDYTEALDALLRSGFWMDAAYVAERVLRTDELKAYVDRAWPPASPEAEAEEREQHPDESIAPPGLRHRIRHLLARRLTRESRGIEAREYVPVELLADHDAFTQALSIGWDEGQSPVQRAKDLFEAGRLARFKGMDLLGTELEPDWRGYGCGVTVDGRSAQREQNFVSASEDELNRARQHRPDPDVRLHYRYQAAFLGWEAAKLMPDQADDTARVLCRAGSWIKYLDPPTADIFYKSLVRRCRKTAIGDLADRMRWFPVLDENGNIAAGNHQLLHPQSGADGPAADGNSASSVYPLVLEKPDETASPSTALEVSSDLLQVSPSSQEYVVQRGDTLSQIAGALAELGVHVTPEQIVAANPRLNLSRLRIGQRLSIPLGTE